MVSTTRRTRVEPHELGAAARLGAAVKLATRVRRDGFVVPLKIEVPTTKLERYLAQLGKETRREPVDARLILRKLKPFATKSVPGRRLQEAVALRQIRLALKLHSRDPIELPFVDVRPKVTEARSRRGDRDPARVEGAPAATRGRSSSGRSGWRPGSRRTRRRSASTRSSTSGGTRGGTRRRIPAWAAGKQPIPPGPGNPLGTRWMGISAPYVGIHGTPDAASIGYSASHGCVRMLIPQVEWLFERVEVGTPVFIVAA